MPTELPVRLSRQGWPPRTTTSSRVSTAPKSPQRVNTPQRTACSDPEHLSHPESFCVHPLVWRAIVGESPEPGRVEMKRNPPYDSEM